MFDSLFDRGYQFGSKLALIILEKRVLRYIERNPGQRLYQIDRNTIKSHHNWGAKFVVERLLFAGKIHTVPVGRAKWPTYYVGPHPAGVVYRI